MKRAACTIVSLNFLPYARVLCGSFHQHHPDCDFCILLVDRIPADLDLSREPCRVVPVEDLDIPDFLSVAFKYDILELNTNVNPPSSSGCSPRVMTSWFTLIRTSFYSIG